MRIMTIFENHERKSDRLQVLKLYMKYSDWSLPLHLWIEQQGDQWCPGNSVIPPLGIFEASVPTDNEKSEGA